MKNVFYKESTAAQAKVQATSVPTTATSTPTTLPLKDVSAADDKNSKLIPPEMKPTAGSQMNTAPYSKTPDYYAGIPFDKSTNKYLPQNRKEELLLVLLAKKEAHEKEIQHWSDWTTAMVRQTAQRLGKDKEELKTLRQEKEEEEKFMKDKQIHHPVKDLEVELETTKQRGNENLHQVISNEDKFTQTQWDADDFKRKFTELELKLKSEHV